MDPGADAAAESRKRMVQQPSISSPEPTYDLADEPSAPATAPASTTPAPGRRTAQRTEPPRRRGGFSAWLTVLALLCVAATPLLIDLHRGDVIDPREAEEIARSIETWRHLYAAPLDTLSLDPLMPRVNGQPQPRSAPGVTWLHMIAFTLDPDLPDPPLATADEAVFDARLVSVGLALLTVASVFWAGYSIGTLKTGLFAALVCLANPVFLYDARLGTGDAAQLGFVMFAIAAALWAIRPLRPSAPVIRQGIGWGLCGLSIGLAVLCAGPIAAAWTLAPILLILLLCPHRISHALGLIAALLLAGLMLIPWAVHVHEMDPQAWSGFFDPFVHGHPADDYWAHAEYGGRVTVLLLAAAMPWTLWLVAALLQPFSTSSTGARSRMFLGWGWFVIVGVLVLLTPPTGPGVSDVLILLPVMAVLTGQLFRQLSDLSSEGRHARLWRALRWPQLGMFFAVSLALPAGLMFQDAMATHGFLPNPMVAPMHWTYWAGAAAVLLLLTGLSLRFAVEQHPGRTLIVWAAWVLAAFVMVIVPFTRGPLCISPIKADAVKLDRLTEGAPVYQLGPAPADPRLRLYAQRPLRTIGADQLERLDPAVPAFLLTPMDQPTIEGFVPVGELHSLSLALRRTHVPIVEHDTPAP